MQVHTERITARITAIISAAVVAMTLGLVDDAQADVTSWPIGAGGGGSCPTALAVDGAGNVYASDTDNGRIRKYSGTGTGGDPIGPRGSPNSLLLAAAPGGGIYIYMPSSATLQHYASDGSSLGSVVLTGGEVPWFIASDDAGNIYGLVGAGTLFPKVVKFSPSGAFLTSWGSAGVGPGQFDFYGFRASISSDPSGNIYVGDVTNRIQMFTSSGSFVRQWGGSGSAPDQFNQLLGIAADSEGHVYAGEFGSGPNVVSGVRVFSNDGQYLGTSGSSRQTSALATSGTNVVYQLTCRDIVRYELTKPSVTLAANTANAPVSLRVGDSITVIAFASVPFGTITRYEFDLDGDGSYETTGTSSLTSTTFSTPGKKSIGVRVESDRGGHATATTSIEISGALPRPPKGPVGISINDGAYATNEEDVEINAVWPLGATSVLLSNDGGFKESGGAKSFDVNSKISWRLRAMSSGQLTRIVYARFIGNETQSDDIVLDKTAPVLSSAVASGASGSASARQAKKRKYSVRLRASQKRSGVSVAQFSSKRSGGQLVVLRARKIRGFVKLDKSVSVKATKPPRFVRVQSAAGTWSKWRAIKRG